MISIILDHVPVCLAEKEATLAQNLAQTKNLPFRVHVFCHSAC
jgi:hypothetical protein